MNVPPITPPSERGYTQPEMFVTTEWLADHLSDANVRVIDTDLPEEYAEWLIPGAVIAVDLY